jgi:cell division protease FtsH
MVFEWGMSDKMGPIKYTEERDGFAGEESVVSVSGQTRNELDQEVRSIIDAQYERAKKTIEANRDAVERIAKALLEHETLDGPSVMKLIDGGELPPRRPTVTITKPEPVRKPEAGPETDPGIGQLKPHLA